MRSLFRQGEPVKGNARAICQLLGKLLQYKVLRVRGVTRESVPVPYFAILLQLACVGTDGNASVPTYLWWSLMVNPTANG
jgi:hypothetical protein